MPNQSDADKAAAKKAVDEKAAADKAAAKKAADEKAAADKAAKKDAGDGKPAKRETFGEVKVLAESKTERVLQDDRFVWKETK
ncbi:MAG: hypothetical protein WA961_14695 [Rhodanobacter sp.]